MKVGFGWFITCLWEEGPEPHGIECFDSIDIKAGNRVFFDDSWWLVVSIHDDQLEMMVEKIEDEDES